MSKTPTIQELFDEAWDEWRHGHDTKSAEIWYTILKRYKDEQTTPSAVDALNYLAMYERIWEGRIESDIDIEANIQQAESINYLRGKADSLIELALRAKTSKDALNKFQSARSIYNNLHSKHGIIKLNYFYGMYLIKRGIEKFGHIFNEFQIALQYAIETNKKYYKAQIHHGIGEAFLRLGNLEEAGHHFEISLQIFQYLKNERKTLEVLVSKADIEAQKDSIDSSDQLESLYHEFNERIGERKENIPLSDHFNHLSRFCDLFIDSENYKKANLLVVDLEKILRQTNVNSSLYFQGKMSLALIKGNIQLKLLNLSNAGDLYQYIIRRKSEADIKDLYGALISLAIISLYKYRMFFDTIHLTEAQELIREAIHLSETTDHTRGYLRASMVEVSLRMSVGDMEDLDEMEEIIEKARKKGLLTEARRAQKEITRFKRIITTRKDEPGDRSVENVLRYALEAKKLVWNN
jgi:tetratricopeptide (TPR) repeat protein